MSAIFYHDDTQQKLALEAKSREEKRRGRILHTAILPLDHFYLAEDYHQKYYLRRFSKLMNEFKGIYPANLDFVNSTAAARVNGYVGGHGTLEDVKADLLHLGLSAEGQKRLLKIVSTRRN